MAMQSCSGRYAVNYQGGEERFSLHAGPQGIRYRAQVVQAEGFPVLTLDADFDPALGFQRMEIANSHGHRARSDAQKSALHTRIEEAGETRESSLSFEPLTTEVDWRSPFFNAVTALRLALAIGESRAIDVRFFDPDTFEPRIMEQHYACVASEEISVNAGRFSCVRYQYSTVNFSAPFWMTKDGIVVRYGEIWELRELARDGV